MENCVYAKKCGGCAYQGVEYKKQLKRKKKWVADLLKPYCEVERIVGMEDPYHYRHKVHAAFGHVKGKGIVAGVYKEGTHHIVDIDSCQIENEKADAIIRDIKGLMGSFKIKAYDEDKGFGLLRHVLVRCGYHTKEYMVVLVLADPILPSKNNFVKALRKLHPEISTVVININDKRTGMVLGERNITIYGKGYIEDELCGRRFRISPSSFYQVNPEQTEILYREALDMAELKGRERIVDAYCGTGTIGIIAAEKVKEVIGVELNKDAVRDALNNARMNQVKNISFYSQDAGKFLCALADQKETVDVVIMDPPRSGSSEEFLNAVTTLMPEKVLYISCNPETLARDLKYLTAKGYRAKKAVAFDLFPFAGHVESCVLLERVSNRKADSYVKLNVKMEDYYRIKDAEKKTDE
ncbi:MAG: 23S rRNA (uracil(1939)-C(5))-methyltransferase RlmD [Lachnospiraceae bacterium]|jgi:23S rRNA (uracil1939-C5)-methyltransferase|nr:23S rRNA (uracil(1939)-C(5))-methyltransferase RlmD [Lachnospiraceae bacterium]